MSDFAAFARGSICSTFIDSVPLIEIARATSTVEMAPHGGRHTVEFVWPASLSVLVCFRFVLNFGGIPILCRQDKRRPVSQNHSVPKLRRCCGL